MGGYCAPFSNLHDHPNRKCERNEEEENRDTKREF